MNHFSCADFTFPLLSHRDSFKLIKMLGFDYVDIGLFQDRSHLQPSVQLVSPEKKGKELKKMAEDEGLKISDVFLQTSLDFAELAINHPNSKIRKDQRELFLNFIDFTAAAGCLHCTGLPGVQFDENSWEICKDELLFRVNAAKMLGIAYAVEAHFGSIIEQPESTINMLEEAEGLTLTLDHSHYTAQGLNIELTRPLMAYASHMHVRGAKKGEMQTSVARSDTDFKIVAQHIKEAKYSGCICMEYTYVDWENCNRTDNVSESIILLSLMKKLLN